MKPIVLAVSAVFLVVGCNDDSDRCDPFDVPVAAPGIAQGMAGYGASPSDVCDGLIPRCACSPLDVDVDLFFAGTAVPDDAEARRIVTTEDPITVSTGQQGYEQALDAGLWLACLDRFDRQECALVVVDEDKVTSVHALSSIGLVRLVVFGPDGERIEEPRIFNIDNDDVDDVDCPALSEAACDTEPRCERGAGTPEAAYCANDFSQSVFFACFEREAERSCGEEVVCIETPAGRVYRTNNCFTAGYERCDICGSED